ncbi:MAG TPA: methylmalonyl Co-A mutase-associated GTPase MeaB [Acidimicrobiales bacterium]|nr:methylmalonyl Co-A mutase-associated GTPase MeaB [Acidimicrobiales bacterium]
MTTASRDPDTLLAEARKGDRVALARLLSVVERGGPPSRALARLAYREPPPYTVGLTGAPGAGKSTLTNRLIAAARAGWPPVAVGEDHAGGPAAPTGAGAGQPSAAEAGAPEPGTPEPVDQVAVIAVDPSSPFTGGAILGDRVRMQDHATDPSVFVRSMATRGHLGGLTLAVPDAVRVLGAVGMPVVIVETVGVGQMEVDVASATDTTIVVVNPGWGDAMQANKAGLLEVADLFVINKADRPGAREARRDLQQMLDLSMTGDWRPPIVDTVAATGDGVDALWAEVARHRAHLAASGLLAARRRQRLTQELRRVLVARLLRRVEEVAAGAAFADAVAALADGRIDPYDAADLLLDPLLDPAAEAGAANPTDPAGPAGHG